MYRTGCLSLLLRSCGTCGPSEPEKAFQWSMIKGTFQGATHPVLACLLLGLDLEGKHETGDQDMTGGF